MRLLAVFLVISLTVCNLTISLQPSGNPLPEPVLDVTPTATIPWIDPTPTGETEQPARVCNNTAGAVNLRAGAGTSYSKAGVLQPDECVTWLDTGAGEGGSWYWVCLGWSPGSCAGTAYVAAWVTDLRN